MRPYQIIELVIGQDEYNHDDVNEVLETLELAMEMIWLDGMADDQIGSVTEDGLHIFRVEQYTLETTSDGNKTLYQHDSIKKAVTYMDSRF